MSSAIGNFEKQGRENPARGLSCPRAVLRVGQEGARLMKRSAVFLQRPNT